MAVTDQPPNNVIQMPRNFAGRQRVGTRISTNGFVVADNSPLGGFQHLAPQTQEFDATARRQLADTQIDTFEQALRMQNPLFKLDEVTKQRIRGLATDPSRKSEADVISAVRTATSSAVPADAKNEIDAYLKQNNIAPEEYYAALAKVGAGMSPDQVMAAYRAQRAREASGLAADGSAYNSGSSQFRGDLGSISMSNYTSQGSQFYATGMTYGTFEHLRSHRLPDGGRFDGNNILHAGQDAKTHGFNPNDRRVAVNFATVDKYDGARREERNALLKDLKGRVETDAEMQALKKAYHAAATEEERKRIAGQIESRGHVLQQEGGYAPFVERGPEKAKKAGKAIGADIVAKSIGLKAQHRADLGNQAVNEAWTVSPLTSGELATVKRDEQSTLKKSDADLESEWAALDAPKKAAEVRPPSGETGTIIIAADPDKTKPAGATVVVDAGTDKDKAPVPVPKAKEPDKATPVVVAQNTVAKPAGLKA